MEEEPEIQCCKFCNFPKRYVTIALLSLLCVASFGSRDSTLVTVRYLLHLGRQKGRNLTSNDCPKLAKLAERQQENIKPVFSIKSHKEAMRSIGECFYLGYLSTHLIGGILVDKYGGKHVVTFSIITTAIITLCTPSVFKIGTLLSIKVMRVLFGLSQGLLLPAILGLMAHWVPKSERATLASVVHCGIFQGIILSNTATPAITKKTSDWTLPFYIFGGMGLGFGAIWQIFGFSNPDDNPYITSKERKYLHKLMSNTVDHGPKAIPWRKILRSVELWTLTAAICGHLFVWNVIVSFLNSYNKRVLQFDMRKSRVWGAVPFSMMGVMGMIFGVFSDWVVNTGRVNVVTIRKVCTNVGIMGPAVYLVGASFAGCHQHVAQAMFIIALGTMGCAFVGIRIVSLDLAPNYAGIITAISDGCGMIAGTYIGQVVDLIAPERRLLEFRNLFYLCFVLNFVTNLVFAMFGKAEVTDWNRPQPKIELRLSPAPVPSKNLTE